MTASPRLGAEAIRQAVDGESTCEKLRDELRVAHRRIQWRRDAEEAGQAASSGGTPSWNPAHRPEWRSDPGAGDPPESVRWALYGGVRPPRPQRSLSPSLNRNNRLNA